MYIGGFSLRVKNKKILDSLPAWAQLKIFIMSYGDVFRVKRTSIRLISSACKRILTILAPFSDLPVQQEAETLYAGATFVSAIVVTSVCCLLVGFGSGWLASKKCAKDDYRSCGHRYLVDQQIKYVLFFGKAGLRQEAWNKESLVRLYSIG